MDSFFPVVRFLFPIYVFTVFFWKGRWVGFPVSVSKRNFQSMRNNSPKKNNYPSPSLQSSLFLVSFTVHLLCNVGVHFTVLWCPRQVFSFYKSLYPLFDYHRARKKTCPELLSDLNKHTKKKRRTESNSIKIVVHYLKNENGFCKMDEFLTSATRTLCCIFFLDFMIRTMAASISCFLSSSTFCRVSFLSGSDSPCLAATGKIGYRNCITERKCPNSTSKNAMVTQPPCNSKYFRTEAFTYA